MSMKIIFLNILIALLLIVLLPETLLGQEAHEEKERKNEISLFLGATSSTDATAFTIGLDYQYRISRVFGVGAIFDHATGEINSILVAPALFLHVKRFSFIVAPGVEFSDENTEFVSRVGVGYVIEISRFSISPALFFDTERDENPSLVYGVSLGFEF